MRRHAFFALTALLCAGLTLTACGNRQRDSSAVGVAASGRTTTDPLDGGRFAAPDQNKGSSLWDVFGPDRTEQTVQVNRFLWQASLDVLGFLPIQSVDPFTGLIVTGYGTPPGGGRSYRATIHISDPALDARSLKVSMQTRGGSVSAATSRAIEDAILTRARQLRIADNKL